MVRFIEHEVLYILTSRFNVNVNGQNINLWQIKPSKTILLSPNNRNHQSHPYQTSIIRQLCQQGGPMTIKTVKAHTNQLIYASSMKSTTQSYLTIDICNVITIHITSTKLGYLKTMNPTASMTQYLLKYTQICLL